jgi:hypothetical protein
MLPLDDPSWSNMEHAYGAASDIPGLLSQLAASPEPQQNADAEPWFTLWSSLCHQGDVYTASYAALPHIVRIGLDAAGEIDFSFMLLPTSIEVARATGRGPDVPPELAEAYAAGLALLMDCVSAHRNDPWDKSMALSAAAAQAAAKGHIQLAGALMNLDDDWISRLNNPDTWD